MSNINSGIVLRNYDSINIGLAVLFAWVPITSLASAALGELYQQTSLFLILQLIYLGAIFNAIPAIFRGPVKNSFIFFVLGFATIYGFSAMACSDSVLKSQTFRNFYLWCLPYFLLSFRVKDFSLLFNTLKIVGVVALVCEALILLVFTSISSYSQESGYDALLPFVVFYLSFNRENKKLYLILVILSFMLILMSGSRGPLLCAILAFIAVFLYKNRFSKKTFLYSVLLIFVFLLYSFFQEQILSWMLGQFSGLSVSTRSIEMLMNREIASDDIRDSLRNESFAYAINHPFIGSGFLNDRVYLYKFGFITSSTATVYGSYSHFFIAEVLIQFGLIPGIIILFVFVKNILRRITVTINVDESFIFLIIISIGVFPLLVSRSWFSFQYFYLVLGLLFTNTSNQYYGGVDKEELSL